MHISIRRTFVYCFSFIIFLLSGSLLFAQQRAGIRLINNTLQPAPNAAHWLDSMAEERVHTPVQVLIQFYTLPSAQERAMYGNNGITLLEYVPNNTYTALVEPPVNMHTVGTGNIRSITVVQPEWKACNYIWKAVTAQRDKSIEVLMSFYGTVDKSIIRQFIQQSGAQLIPDDNLARYCGYKVIVAADKLHSMAEWYGVRYITPVSQYALLDYGSKALEKANILSLPISAGGYGLKGDSVVVGVGDNVSGIYHVDIKDRIINYNPAAITHHGVHINGIVGDAAIIDPHAEGMIPHVTLVDHLYDNVWFLTGLMLSRYNMTITNNSYSAVEGDCSYSGVYDFYAQALDETEQQYPTVQHVFAAGNDGGLNCSPYPAGFGTIPGGYQPAKNTLCVTSTDKFYNNAWDGSRGPVLDGRMKPDMAANGVNVFSTIDYTSYEVASGTSMASPQVAGALGLLTQQYRRLHGAVNPRGDVLKAIVMNGTTDIGNPGPDYRFGFGMLNTYRSLQILNNNRYTTNTIINGATQSFTITVPVNTAKLKVMLYWHDTAASLLSAQQLVNDLDLTVSDPSASVHKPLVLDTAIANINNNAAENEDHINNAEQVTIDNPAAGNYTVTVKGYNVPSANQAYVVAYDFIPTGLQLTCPYKGDVIDASDSIQVYWDASDDTHTLKLEYSTDNGGSWTTIDNNIPATQLYYFWHIPNISSDKCLLRLSRNGVSQQSVSGPFVINPQPVVSLDSVQCPGYIRIHWNAITNATGYEVMRKKGPYMQPVDTVTGTSYTLSGLSLDSTYYAAVRPLINGTPGYRSIAVARHPNDGTCTGSFSNGDVMLQKILAPNNGRKYTSTQLGFNQNLIVLLRNLDDASCNTYKISYNINGGAWVSQNFTMSIPANGIVTDTIKGLNLSATGTYHIAVAVTNLALADPVKQNDSATKTILYLGNDTISLVTSSFTDDFETMPTLTVQNDSLGISPNGHWDFYGTTDTAMRLRTYVDDSILISGSRSMSMDAWQTVPGNQNYLTGTFNLGNYNAATDEVRMEFDYIVHGIPKFAAGNNVWVHGYDVQGWQPLFSYNTSNVGIVQHSGTLSVTDALYNHHQAFSPSFQVRFGQNDTSLIAARNFGNGITVDNFKLYLVHNDVQLVDITSPQQVECGSSINAPVTVRVYDGVHQSQSNILMYYRLDGGTVIKDTLPSIAGKDTVYFTFKQQLALTTGQHTLSVWLANAGDTYHTNDSVLNYTFHTQPLIATYPYLENFEQGDGGWYTDGIKDSWQYGTPASKKIHKAASGTKAWKTNLVGNYNNLETSYLYSPCFDISGLTNPMLSLSFASDIENCGATLCDAGYIEYSTEGSTWNKLGATGQGTNWYDSTFDIWNTEGNTRWHVASIPLPASTQPIRLRFVLKSDPGFTLEGMAVDDIHIFDLGNPVYTDNNSITITHDLSSSIWTNYATTGQQIAEVNSFGQTVPKTAVTLYHHDQLANTGNTQYYFSKSFTVGTGTPPADSVGVRLFITDQDVLSMVNDTTCPSCTRPEDAYSLGITQYDDPDKSKENGTLGDNLNGTYTYYPYQKIKWVPYDNGYYAEKKFRSFSELWLNDGGPTGIFPIGIDYLVFNARRINYSDVAITWNSYIDTAVNTYEIQRSPNDSNFSTINTVNATHLSVASYNYLDTPTVTLGSSIYYRLKWTMLNGKVYYSPVRRVDWTDEDQLIAVYPNPTRDGKITIQWTAKQGAEMQVAITDVTGRTVYRTGITATEWNNTTTLYTGKYGSGVYFLRIIINGKEFTQKIVYQ